MNTQAVIKLTEAICVIEDWKNQEIYARKKYGSIGDVEKLLSHALESLEEAVILIMRRK